MSKVEKQLGFVNADGDDVTANQAYKEAVQTGTFKGTFTEYLDKYGNKGLLNSAIDTIGKIKNLFGPPAPGTSANVLPGEMSPDNSKSTTILGMKPVVAIIVGTVVIGALGYGIYKLVKK